MVVMIGKSLWMDEHLTTLAQSSFFRVCVHIDLTQKLSLGFSIKVLNGRFFQRVEYEGVSHLYFHCGIIGHKVESCPCKNKQQSIDSTIQPSSMENPTIPMRINQFDPSSSQPYDHLGTWNVVTRKTMYKQKGDLPANPSKGQEMRRPFPMSDDSIPVSIILTAQKPQQYDISKNSLNLSKQKPRVL